MTLCLACKKRSNCRSLCQQALQYADQDHGSRQEVLLKSSEALYPRALPQPPENKVRVLELHYVRGRSRQGIADETGLSYQYVCRVIREHRGLMVDALRAMRSGRGKQKKTPEP